MMSAQDFQLQMQRERMGQQAALQQQQLDMQRQNQEAQLKSAKAGQDNQATGNLIRAVGTAANIVRMFI
jgi:hypothetical protein